MGNARIYHEIKQSDCDKHLKYDNVTMQPYYPCGLIANSIFSDTFNSPTLLGTETGDNRTEYKMEKNWHCLEQ
jgi:hypothetical protein